MNEDQVKWVKRGFKDFFLVVLLGMLLVLFCFSIISALVFIGMPAEYASTIISLCLLFAGSMMFSYFEFKKECLEKERQRILNEAKLKKSQSKRIKNVIK